MARPEEQDLPPLTLDFRENPLAYPGPIAEHSMLILPECSHPMTPRTGRRLGQARLLRCNDCRADDLTQLSLNYELLMHNAANIDSRYPVVAVGSNAAPAVVRAKMQRQGVSCVTPFVKARLTNIDVGHSAHVSVAGYIPAAPFHSDGNTSTVIVGWLDSEQLRQLDVTEPNYVRRLLSSDAYPLELEGGERIERFFIYVSKWGLLADKHRRPLRFRTQVDVHSVLADWQLPPWVGHDAADAADRLNASEELRARSRDLLHEQKLTVNDRISHLGTDTPTPTYGAIKSSWAGVTPRSDGLICTGTADDLERLGEQCIVLSERDARQLSDTSARPLLSAPPTHQIGPERWSGCSHPRISPRERRVPTR